VLQWMLEQKDQTPVIVLTGAGSEDIAVEAMKLGAYDYLRKDQVDLPHLPIIINGVHERHLFRNEKEKQNSYLHILEDSRGSIRVFDNAMFSLSQVINNSLSLLFLNLREFFQHYVVPFQTEENQLLSRAALEDIEKELEIVSTSMKSVLSLVASMQDKFAGNIESGRTLRASPEKAATEARESKA
jgi:CheY-like chemotaxis protein